MVALMVPGRAGDAPVSFRRDIQPILRASCVACHKPSKEKGELDVTTHAALLKGGKHQDAVIPGSPERSRLIRDVSGSLPVMPEEGEPLLPAEIAVLARWIAAGAPDDSPAAGSAAAQAAPVYTRLPAVSALAWAPGGALLAVAAHNEVLLFAEGASSARTRLRGDAARVESLAFSADGRRLASAGGTPSEFGEICIWNPVDGRLLRAIRTSTDVVHGVSFSDDGSLVAVGCADKLVRVFSVESGEERMRCDNHIDWVLATAFTHDGQRVVSASRDRALKLIDLATGRLIDDVSIPREPLLSLARHPDKDLVAFGGAEGQIRLNRMEPRGGRLAEGDNKELSFVRELGRLNGSVSALAFNREGNLLAAVSLRGDARVLDAADGKKVSTLKTTAAPLFAVAFHPTLAEVAAAGFDGKVRVFNPKDGSPIREFDCVPLSP
jgi:hypothetical protein